MTRIVAGKEPACWRAGGRKRERSRTDYEEDDEDEDETDKRALWDFVIRISFVLRHLSFVIPTRHQSTLASIHALIRREKVIALDHGVRRSGRAFDADHGARGGFGGDLIIGAELEELATADAADVERIVRRLQGLAEGIDHEPRLLAAFEQGEDLLRNALNDFVAEQTGINVEVRGVQRRRAEAQFRHRQDIAQPVKRMVGEVGAREID